jgi:hypothetical protein
MRNLRLTTRVVQLLFVALVILGISSASEASTITWSAATNVSGDSDVATTGTRVGAFNVGAAGVLSTTVNGVLFDSLVLTGASVTSGNFQLAISGTTFSSSNGFGSSSAPFSTLSAGYQALLSSGGGDFATPFTLTMSGLIAGNSYLFQWWDNRSSGAGNSQLTTATAGNSITLNSQPSLLQGGVGQFATGTFIADATGSQTISFGSTSLSTLSGFQLRDATSVPEPGSMLLLIVGLFGLATARRRFSNLK